MLAGHYCSTPPTCADAIVALSSLSMKTFHTFALARKRMLRLGLTTNT